MPSQIASTPGIAAREQAMTAALRDMVLGSPRLTGFSGGAEEVDRMLGTIENVWLEGDGSRLHLDLHRSQAPKATIVFQPGSGAHGRVYFLLGGLMARRGYHFLAIDRPGHGLSAGEPGDCTVEEALDVCRRTIEWARSELKLPVVLMGSSMGGLLTIFALLAGLRPELAVAHNFVYPGKLVSMRLRARYIERRRTRPYPLTELVHGFERLSDDPSVQAYMSGDADPGFARALSARGVASMFAFRVPAPAHNPPLLVITGGRDTAIPSWATRFFTWWSGLHDYEVTVLPGLGHLLFHDHLGEVVPVVSQWLDERIARTARAPMPDNAAAGDHSRATKTGRAGGLSRLYGWMLRRVWRGSDAFGPYRNFARADLSGRDLSAIDLHASNFAHATLAGTNLSWSDLRRCNFRAADLSNAILRDSNLRAANLRDTGLRGADLRGANLRRTWFRGARADARTVWPEGFDPGARGVLIEAVATR